MRHVLTAAALALLTTGVLAPTAMAHDSYSSIKDIHIDRQCDRYGNFCGKSGKASNKHTYAKKRTSIAKNAYRWYDKNPFIERQCTRYGHFC